MIGLANHDNAKMGSVTCDRITGPQAWFTDSPSQLKYTFVKDVVRTDGSDVITYNIVYDDPRNKTVWHMSYKITMVKEGGDCKTCGYEDVPG
jgi:hypothetical protein